MENLLTRNNLFDVLNEFPTLLDDITFIDSEHTNLFIRMLTSKWGYYLIEGNTIGDFKRMVNSTFNLYSDYYKELIEMYEKEIPFEEYSRTVIADFMDLPHKKVETPEEYLTTRNSTTESGTNDLLGLKQSHMRFIRNIYLEFANRFAKCFMEVWSWIN